MAVTFLTGVAKNKSSTAVKGGKADGEQSKTKAPKAKKIVDISDDEVAPTVPKRKKEEDLYKNFLEEKSRRESGWRLMRLGDKKKGGEVRGKEEVNEGKCDEKGSDLGKESQQIEMVRTEKERREREGERSMEEVQIWQNEKRKWEEEWRREELERREMEKREWEQKWKKEELERREKEKREWEEKWSREEVERRERERKEWEEERRKEEVGRRETEKNDWEEERRKDAERKEKERRELEEERRKEDVQRSESLQEDVTLLPSDLDWVDWSLDSPTTSQQSSENWQSQMNEVK